MKFPARLLAFVSLASVLSAGPALTVSTPDKALTLTAEEFAALPHVQITALDPHAKATHVYSGVAMAELLTRAGAPLGDKLRGRAQQMVVLARSKDNYVVAYALAEFDAAFSDRQILLADSEDGKALGQGAGPYRIVMPGDKKAARWARMITSIEVKFSDPDAPAKIRTPEGAAKP